jgi:hypothetical protein
MIVVDIHLFPKLHITDRAGGCLSICAAKNDISIVGVITWIVWEKAVTTRTGQELASDWIKINCEEHRQGSVGIDLIVSKDVPFKRSKSQRPAKLTQSALCYVKKKELHNERYD